MIDVKEMALVYINRKENSQKYYVIKLCQADNETEPKHVVSIFGRLDRPIENILRDNRKATNIFPKSFESASNAQTFYDKKVQEKLNKGYNPAFQRDDGKYSLELITNKVVQSHEEE